MKKLIFLKDGIGKVFNWLFDNINNDYMLDGQMSLYGYNAGIEHLEKGNYMWVISSYPAILSLHDNKGEPYWWNEKDNKWEIYFIENNVLKNIQEYTDRELRKVHNIEKLYLAGGLDNV